MPIQRLPQELMSLIFEFITPQEAMQLMNLCRGFHAAGVDRINRYLVQRNITIHVRSRGELVLALTMPLTQRIERLEALLTSINESIYRYQDDPTAHLYRTTFIPFTLPENHPLRRKYDTANISFREQITDRLKPVAGAHLRLGYDLTRAHLSEDEEVVEALDLFDAIHRLIIWLLQHRYLFLQLH